MHFEWSKVYVSRSPVDRSCPAKALKYRTGTYCLNFVRPNVYDTLIVKRRKKSQCHTSA